MKSLLLLLSLFLVGCTITREPNIEVIESQAARVAHTIDDICQDVDKPYKVTFIQTSESAGNMNCKTVSYGAAQDCIGVNIRTRRDVVIYGSAIVFISKRDACPQSK